MGGEKRSRVSLPHCSAGSPPHGRGKGVLPFLAVLHPGITPAWAGKRYWEGVAAGVRLDHPRMGGEKWMTPKGEISYIGSPPHGRGKVCLALPLFAATRITPAWAGKSRLVMQLCIVSGDHPRMGGEKAMKVPPCQLVIGSPPHGRGKAIRLVVLWLAGRITPAWAGKRLKRSHRSGIFISGPIPFHSVLHRPAGSGGSRAGRDGSPAGQPQNAGPA